MAGFADMFKHRSSPSVSSVPLIVSCTTIRAARNASRPDNPYSARGKFLDPSLSISPMTQGKFEGLGGSSVGSAGKASFLALYMLAGE